jgi:hypothetical protein
VATGRTERIDQAQAEWLLALMLGMGFDVLRLPGVFGPAVPVPTAAPPHLRLLGFLGREVGCRRQGVVVRRRVPLSTC